MPKKKKIDLSQLTDEIKKQMVATAYGENVGQADDVLTMTLQSMLGRYASGRPEFGSTMPEILHRGYYAQRNQNQPYREASSGQFHDEDARQQYIKISNILNALLQTQNIGDTQFYFTPQEVRQQQKAGFKFNQVRQTGQTGKYQTYAY